MREFVRRIRCVVVAIIIEALLYGIGIACVAEVYFNWRSHTNLIELNIKFMIISGFDL